MSIKTNLTNNTIESTDGIIQLVHSAGNQPTIVQQVFVVNGSVATGSQAYDSDDTIPQQSTDADMFLSASITPLDASNILLVEAIGNITSTGTDIIMGIWRDSTEDALAICWDTPELNDLVVTPIRMQVVAGSTGSTTFKLGIGSNTGTHTFNGHGGSAFFGGTIQSSIMITELST